MATIKSYTSLEQSRKLAEILPIESADMEFMFLKRDNSMISRVPFVKDGTEEPDCPYNMVACWSLTALLSVLPKIDNYRTEIRQENNCFCCAYTQIYNNGDLYWYYADNPVDTCYKMILKLHEMNLL